MLCSCGLEHSHLLLIIRSAPTRGGQRERQRHAYLQQRSNLSVNEQHTKFWNITFYLGSEI